MMAKPRLNCKEAKFALDCFTRSLQNASNLPLTHALRQVLTDWIIQPPSFLKEALGVSRCRKGPQAGFTIKAGNPLGIGGSEKEAFSDEASGSRTF
jgi:hypothetical protein